MKTWNRILTVVLGIMLVAAIAGLVYVLQAPKGEKLTEFYILGASGKAVGYPKEFSLVGGRVSVVRYDDGRVETADRARVIVGIINREQQSARYTIRLSANGTAIPTYFEGKPVSSVGPVVIADGEKWEQEIDFAPVALGKGGKVEFILEKNGMPYFKAPPYLLIDVTAAR